MILVVCSLTCFTLEQRRLVDRKTICTVIIITEVASCLDSVHRTAPADTECLTFIETRTSIVDAQDNLITFLVGFSEQLRVVLVAISTITRLEQAIFANHMIVCLDSFVIMLGEECQSTHDSVGTFLCKATFGSLALNRNVRDASLEVCQYLGSNLFLGVALWLALCQCQRLIQVRNITED